MFSIPKRLYRPALLALVAAGTVGGSISAASAQSYGGGYDRDGDGWRHAPRYHEHHYAGYPRHYGQPYYRGGYVRAYHAPVYYGGYQSGYYNPQVVYGGYQGGYYPSVTYSSGGYYPAGGYDRQGYDGRYDNNRDDRHEWREERRGYDDDDDD
jgi:hypothetical protein